MANDLETMRGRDRRERMNKLYNHSSSASVRERDGDAKRSPEAAMAVRHADEIGEQRARHHGESQRLYQNQAEARAKRLQTSHGLDGNLDRDTARARDEMHERHGRERGAMQRRHLVERDNLRRKNS
jgi:hypothetical protein